MRRCCDSCLRLQIVPAVRMLALCLRQSIRVVEAIVEVNVYVRRLVTQYGPERRAVGREALVTVVDVFAVHDGSIDSRFNKAGIGYTRPVWLRAPSTITSPINEITAALATGKKRGMRASKEYLSNNCLA
jgi:hypothetical protein